MPTKRVPIGLPDKLVAFLDYEAVRTGLSVADVIRHLIAYSKEYLAYDKLSTTVVRQQTSEVDKAKREAVRAARDTERAARVAVRDAERAASGEEAAYFDERGRVWANAVELPFEEQPWWMLPHKPAYRDETERMYYERHNMSMATPYRYVELPTHDERGTPHYPKTTVPVDRVIPNYPPMVGDTLDEYLAHYQLRQNNK